MKNIITSKEKPQICAIDLDREIVETLQSKGLHCFNGTLGSQVEFPLQQVGKVFYPCKLNWSFPENFHEYDIVIVDLQNREPITYFEPKHRNLFPEESKQDSFFASRNERIFNPRPLSFKILNEKLNDFFAKETLMIVFCSANELSSYYPAEWDNDKRVNSKPIKVSLYTYMRGLGQTYIKDKIGKKVVVADVHKNPNAFLYNNKNVGVSSIHKQFNAFLYKYKKDFIYKVIFRYPSLWLEEAEKLEAVDDELERLYKLENKENSVKQKDFVPLLLNCSDEIIGFIDFSLGSSGVLAFPELHHNKKEFLLELIDEILPGLFPNIFPSSEQFYWLKSENYFLPNQANIMAKKTQLEDEYKAALNEIHKELQENTENYKFLHDLITETGEALVKSIEKFLIWVGFKNVLNMDETNPSIKEEDIQVNLEPGLLVIEIKGIRGTSKDSDCEQVGKIKYRRAKERNSFDVFGLYIVNHQRHLPPAERKNPPFNEQQIDDAQLNERGLLTTYEIFKLYSYIEKQFITKEDARNFLLIPGLVQFKPSISSQVGYPPLEIHRNGQVVIFTIAILNDSLCMSVLMNFGKIKFMFLGKKLKQKFDNLKRPT